MIRCRSPRRSLSNRAPPCHIMAVVVAFGVTFAYPIMFAVGARPPAQPAAAAPHRVHDRALADQPGLVVVLAAGIFLASDGHHWSEFFVQWGFAAVIVIGALVGSVMIPTAKRAEQAAERDIARRRRRRDRDERGVPGARQAPVRVGGAAQRARARDDPVHGRSSPRAARSARGTLARWSEGYRVAVVGATGQVGTLMLQPAARARVPARARSCRSHPSARSGASSRTGSSCRGSSEEAIAGFDIALFSAGGRTSGEWAPRVRARGRGRDRQLLALAHGATTSRSSSARSTPTRSTPTTGSSPTPTARPCRWSSRSSRCTTRPGIERLVICTYQAVSGTGKARRRRAARPVARAAARARHRAARAATPTRSPSTPSPTPAASPTATTTPTRSAS